MSPPPSIKLKSPNPDLDTSQLAASEQDQELLNKAIAIIEENIGNPEFDINGFAAKMLMGRSSLFSKIKGLTGETPKDFISTIRMKKSLAILNENPDKSAKTP